jgi:hypothetical protein
VSFWPATAREEDDSKTNVLRRSAVLATQFERYPKALEHWKKLVELDPKEEFASSGLKRTLSSLLHRAKMAQEAGETGMAAEYLRTYVRFQTSDDEAFAEYALLVSKLCPQVLPKPG